MRKFLLTENKGFTMIELLLVIAIIGILAGAVMVGIGQQRERAQASAALETARSALPYAVECYIKEGSIMNPVIGGAICSGTSVKWPKFNTGSTCSYSGKTTTVFRVTCGTSTIVCDYANNAKCEIQ